MTTMDAAPPGSPPTVTLREPVASAYTIAEAIPVWPALTVTDWDAGDGAYTSPPTVMLLAVIVYVPAARPEIVPDAPTVRVPPGPVTVTPAATPSGTPLM